MEAGAFSFGPGLVGVLPRIHLTKTLLFLLLDLFRGGRGGRGGGGRGGGRGGGFSGAKARNTGSISSFQGKKITFD